jgi:hypothetical protein
MVMHAIEERSMDQKNRELRNKVTRGDLISAALVVGFMIVTAILSYFYGDYGILRFIAGGEKLFRFWILVGAVIFVIYGISRLRRWNKNR